MPDGAIRLENEDDVGRVLHQRPEALLARPEPLLLGRPAAVGAPETDDPEAEPAHGRAAEAARTTTPAARARWVRSSTPAYVPAARPVAWLTSSSPGPRRDRPRLIEASREKQREGLVHGGLLHLDRGAHPGRRLRAGVQTKDPVERADAPLVALERLQVEGELLPRLPQPADELLRPGAGRGSPGA